jgi:hypothetical protein
MKRFFTKPLFTLALAFASFTLHAQIRWNFQTASPTSNSYPNITASDVTVGNNNGTTTLLTSTNPSTGYTGASGANNAAASVNAGGFSVTSTYFQTTLTPTATTSVVLTGISFGTFSLTGSGPTAITVRTSLDNFTTDQATYTLLANSTWTFFSSNTLNAAAPNGTPVTVRIYGLNGAGSTNTANWRIDDLTLNPPSNLPLSLTAFAASFNGTASQLKWTSANEINVKGFSVEKSLNGIDFSEIAFVKGQNNIQQNLYSFSDVDVKTGVNYYRLKMINNDGSVKYSNTIIISNKQSLQTTVFPNPVISNVTINHGKAFAGAVLRLFTLDGKLIRTTPVQIGAIQTTLPASQLLKGNYLLIYENNGEKTSVQFTKQ